MNKKKDKRGIYIQVPEVVIQELDDAIHKWNSKYPAREKTRRAVLIEQMAEAAEKINLEINMMESAVK